MLLTAAHVFDNGARGALFGEDLAIEDAISTVRRMPNADVALALLTDDARGLDTLAMDPSSISDETSSAVRKGDTVDVIGFPEAVAVQILDPVRDKPFTRHGDMIHRTVIAGVDRAAISIVWKEGDIAQSSSALYEAAGFKIGTRVNQRKPSGISGGAVWKQLRADDEVWTAEKVFRMVGIPSEFTNGRLLAVPARRWLPWLREQLIKL